MSRNTYDLDQTFGQDLVVSATGDLSLQAGLVKGEQRVVRRLMTNPGSYYFHPEYGAGLPRFVGDALSSDAFDDIRSLINSQIFLESCVSQNPTPEIFLQTLLLGLLVQINYTDSPSKNPVVLPIQVGL